MLVSVTQPHPVNQTNPSTSFTMNPLFSFTCLSIIFSFTVFADKESLVSFLPDDTFFVLEVDNWGELKDDLQDGPWGEIEKFPVWEKISGMIESEMQRGKNKKFKSNFTEAKETVLDPILDSVEGSVVLGVSDFTSVLEREPIMQEDGTTKSIQKMPFFAFISESSLKQNDFDEIISSLKDLAKNAEVEKTKIGDTPLYWILQKSHKDLKDFDAKESGLCLALDKGKLFMLTGGEKSVESVFEKSFEDGKSLVDNQSYIDCFDEIGKGQARIFLNFKEGIRTILESKSKKMEIPQNPFGIEKNGLINGLGLDGLNYLGVCLDAKSGEFEVGSFLGMNHRKGILSFLSPVKGDLENHDFVTKDVFTVSNAKNDLGQLWPKMENILKGISPAIHLLVTSQIQAFEDQSDVRIRADLLGSLGDQFVSVSYLHKENENAEELASPSSSIYAISLRDSKLFDRTMRAMVDSVSQGNELFEENEHRGVTIRSMRGLQGVGLSISYAVLDDWLLLSMGKDRYLKRVINRMKSGGDSLWESSHMESALDDLPRGIRQVDYVDFRSMFSLFETMLDAIDKNEFDFTSDDFGNFPFFLLGWSKDLDSGFVSKAKLYPFSE